MRVNLSICLLILTTMLVRGVSAAEGDTVIYLFPGQGADYRQFKHLIVPPGYDTVRISYPVPEKRETLPHYARRFIREIDRSSPYILMGVSLGGMICTELADTLDPLKTIIISSAKTTGELPGRYTFQHKIPLNRVIPKGITKAGARILQGIVEPDRRYDKETFKDMLKRKDPTYLKRTVDMIINWQRNTCPPQIVHIHGNRDHTIPVRNVHYDYLVDGGSHMMIITHAGEINRIIEKILAENP